MKKMKSKQERQVEAEKMFWENLESWVAYWRLNPHRFCTEYFGLNLHMFQKIIIYLMNSPEILMIMLWASRGLGEDIAVNGRNIILIIGENR